MDLVPRGALQIQQFVNPTPIPTPLHCGPVSRFLIGADLKGESNVTLMKDMPFTKYTLFPATQQLQKCVLVAVKLVSQQCYYTRRMLTQISLFAFI